MVAEPAPRPLFIDPEVVGPVHTHVGRPGARHLCLRAHDDQLQATTACGDVPVLAVAADPRALDPPAPEPGHGRSRAPVAVRHRSVGWPDLPPAGLVGVPGLWPPMPDLTFTLDLRLTRTPLGPIAQRLTIEDGRPAAKAPALQAKPAVLEVDLADVIAVILGQATFRTLFDRGRIAGSMVQISMMHWLLEVPSTVGLPAEQREALTYLQAWDRLAASRAYRRWIARIVADLGPTT
ncbi:MAG: hypothetical protein JWN46_3915 [Acidimicrobiales bacterium]|nr:hypothetical protein [Acidimicrobiales bacterium]